MIAEVDAHHLGDDPEGMGLSLCRLSSSKPRSEVAGLGRPRAGKRRSRDDTRAKPDVPFEALRTARMRDNRRTLATT